MAPKNIHKEILDNIAHAVYLCDSSARIIYINPAAEKLTGWSIKKAVGKNRDEVFSGINEIKISESTLKKKSGQTGIICFLEHTDKNTKGDPDNLRETKEALDWERDFNTRLIQASPAFFVAISPRNRVLLMNELMLKTLGYTLNEVVGHDYLNMFVPAREHKDVTGVFKSIIRSKKALLNENHIRAKNGKELLVEWHGRPIFNKKGAVEFFFGLGIDITQRRHAEEALRENELKFRALAETTSSAIYIWQDGKFIYANPAAVKLTGYTINEILSAKGLDFIIHPDYIPIIKNRLITRQNGDRKPAHYEVKLIAKKGNDIWIDLNSIMIEYKNRPAIIGTVYNITERKKMEEALASEKERLAVTLYSIGEGVITTDINGRIVLANRISEQLTGYTQEEAKGKKLDDIFETLDEKSRTPIAGTFEKIINIGNKKEAYMSSILISKKGEERIISESGAPIRDRESKIVGAVLVFRDITEQRKMEADLIKAQKLESLGVLSGGIAHDFNNILTIIMGNISLAKVQIGLEDHAWKLLTEAERASKRAQDLTQQLLTFSKGGKPVRKVVSIAELLHETISFALSGSSILPELLISKNLWPAEIDEGQISQVINNLIINAQQAMPAGGTIEIKAENVSLDTSRKFPLRFGKYVRITIKDNGTGIAPEHMPKIFDPYFTTKKQGSGLGLTSSYSIIKRHKGHIMAESTPGEGSTFVIYLPATQKKPVIKKEKRIVNGGKKKGKVLLMDDEDSILMLGADNLKFLGYEAETAYDGIEAIDKYMRAKKSSAPFNLVILDLTIPAGMGGIETITRLRILDPEVIAIVSSGYSNDPILSDYKKYGFKGIIAKPYDLTDMEKILRLTVKRRAKKITGPA